MTADLFVDAHSHLGEGPLWDADRRCLWWVDILGRSVHRTDVPSGDDTLIEVGQLVGAVVLRSGGGLLLAVQEGFATLDPESGRIELVAPVEHDDVTTRMNDGKVDPEGRFWAGTMGVDHRPGAGTLYRLGIDWQVTPVVEGVSISNGLDWGPDGRSMYYIDTPTDRVDRFNYEPASGTIADRRTAVAIREGAGSPDGMTVDAEGYLWVALWNGWGVERYAPDGRLDQRVEVPASEASSCAFGGPDLDLLFITTAQEDFPPRGRPEEPHAGGLFVARPGVRGRAPTPFGG
ncbi:MAG: SMP-30/gluconolactonase/LRE family protein [Chloroflexota bacterium]